MHTNEKKVSIAAIKRDIATKTKAIEKELMSAKNDFYIVKALDKLIVILQLELDNWYKLVGNKSDSSEEQVEATISEASEHVANLNSLLETFKAQRSVYIKNALAIQLAMIRCHELKEPVILSEI